MNLLEMEPFELVEVLKSLSTDEVAVLGNFDAIQILVSGHDIEEYFIKRIIAIDNDEELKQLRIMYEGTDFIEKAINKLTA